MRVKICGITNIEDAEHCVSLGVDALGFNFYKESPRYIEPNKTQEITHFLPPFVSTVGVFVNTDADDINKISEQCNLDYVQLHGDESPNDCLKIKAKVIKALRIENEDDIQSISQFQGLATSLLLDTKSESAYGGTGKVFDWGIALKAKDYDMPVILSGGLNAENIARAIGFVNPYAVDICSGIESSPGIKDYNKLEELLSVIRKL